ncbi:MAG TPA: preprotein translocase subunit SecE [Planctomycetota bacterium]|jgi:preprotein translocase SecE subunit
MAGGKELMDDRDVERPEPGPRPESAAAPTSSPFLDRLALFTALAAAFCVAGTVYFLPPAGIFLTRPLAAGSKFVNIQLFVAAAVFAALAWFVLARLAPRLKYQKLGQGRWARLVAYLGIGVMAIFGAVSLHRLPGLGSGWYGGLEGLWKSTPLFGQAFTLRPVFFPAAAFFLVGMTAFHLFANRPKAAEFLIETQGEMKRVSWPTPREWIGSTMVVLVLVAFLSFFLYLADYGLSWILQKAKIGF